MRDVIDATEILSFLDESLKERLSIEVFEKTDSTNRVVRSIGCSGAREGTVVIAGEQTAGRGRMGRSFFSPGDTGVYMSLLLKPKIKPEDAVQITSVAAVSVCRALEKVGAGEPKIKWVNDIFIDNKKVCGILTESSFDARNGGLDFAVLGVGVNIYEPSCGFPEDIKNVAGSVFKERRKNLRNKFVAAFLKEFFEFYENLSAKTHLEEYRDKSFVLGREINVIQGERTESAIALEIDDNCNLIVRFPDGTLKKLYSGEISVKLI